VPATKPLIALLALGLVTAACGSSTKSAGGSATSTAGKAPSGTPIKLMQIATLTGPSDVEPQIAAAGRATVKAVNAAGGVNGHPLVLEVCDDKFDPNAAAACARQAVSDGVAAVVALNSAYGDKVIPIISAAGIPSVGDNLLTAAEFLSKDVFPVDGGGITGSAAMAYAVAHAGAKKVRPMVVDVAAAKGLIPFMQQAVKLFPAVSMLPYVPVPPTATDLTSQGAAAAAGGADGAFFVVGQGQAAELTRVMRQAGFTGTLATSTQSITQQEIRDLGTQANGLLLISAMPPASYTQNPTVQQFDADMKAAGIPASQLDGTMMLAWASVEVARMGLAKAATLNGPGLSAALNNYGQFSIAGLGQWDYSKPLTAYANGALRIFNPYVWILKVGPGGQEAPISPTPFDITTAPTS
jgi:ABC-type branched-subunit amino acid transport system substrate-binding protein